MKIKATFSTIVLIAGVAVSSQAQDDTKPTQDLRLQKTVTISATRILLGDLLEKVTQQTGVRLSADPEDKAWRTRELPVTVQVKDAPLDNFQRQIAKLLDLRWARSGVEGAWVYTLWQDKNSREREMSALDATADTQIQKMKEQWSAIGDEMAKLSQMSPEQQKQAVKDNPFLDFVSSNSFGKAYGGLVSSLAPSAMSKIINSQEFRAPYGSLSPQQRANLQTYMLGMLAIQKKSPQKNPSEEFSGDWSKTAIVFRPMPKGPGHELVDKLGLLGFLHIDGGGRAGKFSFPIVDPNSKMAAVIAEGSAKIQSGESLDSVTKGAMEAVDQFMKTSIEESGKVDVSEVTERSKIDPKLLAIVDLKPKDATDAGGALAELCEEPGINIYAESWRQPGATVKPHKGTAAEIITGAASLFGMTWDYDRGSARIKAKDWAERRAAMVSQASVKYWLDLIERNGALGVDDLAAMVSEFSREQIMTLMLADNKISRNARPLVAPDQRKAILFYASLSSDQARQLRSEQGLSPGRLSEAAHQSLTEILQARGISSDDFYASGSMLKLSESSETGAKLALNYPADKPAEITLTQPTLKR